MSCPSFDELPLRKDDPPFSAWGLYGPDDELGTLNLLTPDVVREAAKEIQTGVRVALDHSMNRLVKPSHNRAGLKHTIIPGKTNPTFDDAIDLNTQVSEATESCYWRRSLLIRYLPNGTDFDTLATGSRVCSTTAPRRVILTA